MRLLLDKAGSNIRVNLMVGLVHSSVEIVLIKRTKYDRNRTLEPTTITVDNLTPLRDMDPAQAGAKSEELIRLGEVLQLAAQLAHRLDGAIKTSADLARVKMVVDETLEGIPLQFTIEKGTATDHYQQIDLDV